MAKKRIFFSIFLLILSICFITDVKALENKGFSYGKKYYLSKGE